jgi:hypothetical protein
MSGDPQHLRRGESGHREVAGPLLEIGDTALELVAFRERTAIVPQDCRPERLVMDVEQSRAMHLARQTDSGERLKLLRRLSPDLGDRRLDALDPVVRILLAP